MSDQPSLKRDNTMAVTAQEGEAFLETQGMKVTDDDVKTRGQKEKLDEITSTTSDGQNSDGPDKPKVIREGTMAVTAKEGASLLEGEDLEKTRGQTAAREEAESKKVSPAKPKVPRESTMAVTAQEGAELLEGEELGKTRGQTASKEADTTPTKVKRSTTIAKTTEASAHILGQEKRGRTRSQTRKGSESDEKKPAVKRTTTMAQTAKEGEEFLQREAKRAKVDDQGTNGGEAEKGTDGEEDGKGANGDGGEEGAKDGKEEPIDSTI